jgi:hypothetical protein
LVSRSANINLYQSDRHVHLPEQKKKITQPVNNARSGYTGKLSIDIIQHIAFDQAIRLYGLIGVRFEDATRLAQVSVYHEPDRCQLTTWQKRSFHQSDTYYIIGVTSKTQVG